MLHEGVKIQVSRRRPVKIIHSSTVDDRAAQIVAIGAGRHARDAPVRAGPPRAFARRRMKRR
jgi:hypothetical protein